MRVAFYTNITARDSLPVLKQLAENGRTELLQVIFFDTMSEARQSPFKIIREFGWSRVLMKLTSRMIEKVRLIIAKTPLRRLLQPRTSFEYAAMKRLDFTRVSNLNCAKAQQELQDWNLDLLIVCICKNILSESTLIIPRLGAINIHPSLLPKYRGPMPLFWMLYHGDTQGGVTFQKMTSQIDDGPIVAQFPFPLNLSFSEDTLNRQLFHLAAEKLDEVMALIQTGNIQFMRPSGRASYFSWPTSTDRAELKRIQRQRAHAVATGPARSNPPKRMG